MASPSTGPTAGDSDSSETDWLSRFIVSSRGKVQEQHTPENHAEELSEPTPERRCVTAGPSTIANSANRVPAAISQPVPKRRCVTAGPLTNANGANRVPAAMLNIIGTLRSEALAKANFLQIELCPNNTAGGVLNHCCQAISRRLSKPTTFKIGITGDPIFRWSNPGFGYKWDRQEKWQGMLLLDISAEIGWSCMLEAALIKHFEASHGASRGLRNTLSGGDGHPDAPCFTYLVFRHLQ